MGSSNFERAARFALVRRRSRGFTVVELMLALGILGVLAAIGGPAYRGYLERVRTKEAVLHIRTIEDQLAAFELEWEVLPETLAAVDADGLLDPWGNAYEYLRIADSGKPGKGQLRKDRNLNPLNSDYDLYSMGPDGDTKTPLTAPQSHDDIIRASDGDYVGIAEGY